jgi:membrane-associated phospholipid phosphatase
MRLASLILIGSLVLPASGKAEDNPNRSRMQVELVIDLPVTLGTVGLNIAPYLFRHKLEGPACGLQCDPATVNALDRPATGNDSRAASRASHYLLASSILTPYLIGAADVLASDPEDGWSGYGKDSFVLFETLSVNLLFNQLVKYTVRRPRPYAYNPDHDPAHRTGVEASLSFYSGHTSTAFAAATCGSYLFTLRHPDSLWTIPVWLGTHALAGATGILRVQAGKHFWTDVLVGAVAGSAFGLLIPWLHKSSSGETSRARSDVRQVFSLGWAF